MAQRVQITKSDDVDGSPATDTVVVQLDEVAFELDLSAANSARLRADIEQWTPYARRMSKLARAGVVMHRVESPYDPRALRAWASARGIALPSRGRIPDSVVEQYREAGY